MEGEWKVGAELRFEFLHGEGEGSWGARNAAGWEMCLDSLELLIQGGTIAKFTWDLWRAKFERYVKKFEPEHGPQDEPPKNIHRE